MRPSFSPTCGRRSSSSPPPLSLSSLLPSNSTFPHFKDADFPSSARSTRSKEISLLKQTPAPPPSSSEGADVAQINSPLKITSGVSSYSLTCLSENTIFRFFSSKVKGLECLCGSSILWLKLVIYSEILAFFFQDVGD